jgi:hypothetical protein
MAIPHSVLFEAMRRAGPSRADALRRMDAVSRLLDTAFLVPGTNQRVGIDAFIGLVPGIGDAVTTLLSSYVIWEAHQLGLPGHVIARMLGNLAIHGTLGIVPFVGDVFIALFRVNRRNLAIVRDYLARHGEPGIIDAVPLDRPSRRALP